MENRMLHQNCERVQAALRAAGLSIEVQELPDSTKTAKEAAQALGVTVAEIAKSIVLDAGDKLLLVVASGANRVSLAKVEALTGIKVTQAHPDKVKEITGYPIGGVPPLAHKTKLSTYIDRDLLQFEKVWAAAGTPKSLFHCSTSDLVKVTSGQIADVKE